MTANRKQNLKLIGWFFLLVVSFFLGSFCSRLSPIGCMTFQNFKDFISWMLPWNNSFVIPLLFLAASLYWGDKKNKPQNPSSKEGTVNETLETRRIEGLKALADWSKWIITIQASFITLVTLKLGGDVIVGEVIPTINSAIFSFSISIFAATMLLGAIPDALALSHKSLPTGTNISQEIYKHPTTLRFSIGAFAAVEHTLFLLGIACIFFGLLLK